MKWHFTPLPANQVETEVTQRTQFDNDEVTLSETIVRESIQNSLDAAASPSSIVTVAFRWVDTDTIDPTYFKTLFEEHEKHAEASNIPYSALDFDKPSALIIEDFGTTGLTGSINSKDKKNFSDFWRRHGKSHKTGVSRGRWGLGKLVYSSASNINTFFGITVREKDSKLQHLMGQTVLAVRTIRKKEYPAHAFFGELAHKGSPLKEITVPISSASMLDKFSQMFLLKRKNIPGLSIIIPFPNEKFNIDTMIKTGIMNYFYPLVTGQLSLKFNELTLDKSNVREYARTHANDMHPNLEHLFDFVETISSTITPIDLTLNEDWNENNKLDDTSIAIDDLSRLRKKYQSGETIALKLPVLLLKKTAKKGLKTHFNLFLSRPAGLLKGMDIYVRGGLTLPGEAKFDKQGKKSFGALVADDVGIASFLGDAENAAHTQWVINAEKARNNYKNSESHIRLIRQTLVQLFEVIEDEQETVSKESLINYFWLPKPSEAQKSKDRGSSTTTPIIILPKKPQRFSIVQSSDGFKIKGTGSIDTRDLPLTLTIRAAYDIPKGNPYKKYSPHDFTIEAKGPIKTTLTGGIVSISSSGNTWICQITSPNFSLSAEKFDTRRDILIDAKLG